jgi:hypothetical protein
MWPRKIKKPLENHARHGPERELFTETPIVFGSRENPQNQCGKKGK